MKGMVVVIFGLVALFVAFCIAIVACSSEAPPQPISQMDAYRLPAAAYESPSIDQQILDADVIVISIPCVRNGRRTNHPRQAWALRLPTVPCRR